MISACHVEQRRSSNPVFFGNADRRLHFGKLAGNDDLTRRVDVGDIDVLIGCKLTNVVLLAADQRRHSTQGCGTSLVHQLASLLHQFQTFGKIECPSRGMRGHFTEG